MRLTLQAGRISGLSRGNGRSRVPISCPTDVGLKEVKKSPITRSGLESALLGIDSIHVLQVYIFLPPSAKTGRVSNRLHDSTRLEGSCQTNQMSREAGSVLRGGGEHSPVSCSRPCASRNGCGRNSRCFGHPCAVSKLHFALLRARRGQIRSAAEATWRPACPWRTSTASWTSPR